jgi:hypothetical protein
VEQVVDQGLEVVTIHRLLVTEVPVLVHHLVLLIVLHLRHVVEVERLVCVVVLRFKMNQHVIQHQKLKKMVIVRLLLMQPMHRKPNLVQLRVTLILNMYLTDLVVKRLVQPMHRKPDPVQLRVTLILNMYLTDLVVKRLVQPMHPQPDPVQFVGWLLRMFLMEPVGLLLVQLTVRQRVLAIHVMPCLFLVI